ncbi:beta-galactosidase [Aureobasidium sp. EXF-10728]|nr:beta-galactosidase [Aureobasidium sp. EXF-10728]
MSLRQPHLRATKTSSQLIVNGEPFLMLAAELHNSSLSNAEYMETFWPEAKAMSVNTLLGSVTWEMIEPEEGRFDFSELDKVILGARKHDMHLVILWFASFKNAMSTYVPGWVKRDVRRFPRVHTIEAGGVKKTLELLSPFNKSAWEADARAFSALMTHLKEFDSQHGTVVMVQVENETGMLGDSRDRSKTAEEIYNSPLPNDLDSTMHPEFQKRLPRFETCEQGITWAEVCSDRHAADEFFMANFFSRYINHVVEAGKLAYDIPYYVNVWLNCDDPEQLDIQGIPVVVGGGGKPGIYPSGGPVPHLMDLYKHNIPSLDFIGPDLYVQYYEKVCQNYRHQNQPLFIPEQCRDERGARRLWLAIGTYLALGCSPFGIDTETAVTSPFTRHYRLMNSVRKQILEAQANRPEDIMGFFFDEVNGMNNDQTWERTFGQYDLTIERSFVFGKPGPGSGIIIHQGEGVFLLVGWGFQVRFKSIDSSSTFTGILFSEEKTVDENGVLHTARVLNGDETQSGAFISMPNEEPDYGGFPVPVTIPCRTMIAECTAYHVTEDEKDM